MNIYDIAEKCGVSIATVSRVLNNNPNVSAATRAKIQAVIDEANYTPSAIARNLGNGAEAVSAAPATAAPTVGVLCSDIRDPYCANILSALVEQMKDSGVDLLLGQSGDPPESEKAALTRMLAHPVIAVMYIGPNHYDNPTDAPLATAAAQVPVILLDGYVEAPNIYGIIGDQPAAVTEIVAGLLRRQRRRILLLHSRVTHSCREKIRGYQQAYAAAGLEVDPALIVEVGNRPEDINTTIKQLLVKRVTFDAIIGTEDMVALGAQKALQRTGLSMPVVGFHNTLIASCSTPALTSVECDPAAMAAAAVTALEDLQAGRAPRTLTVIPTKLVERDTYRNA